MTTIIYDHKKRQIAIDSRQTAGDEIKSNSVQKWVECDGSLYFFAGIATDISDFINGPKERGAKPPAPLDCHAFIIRDGKCFKASYSGDIGYWQQEMDYSDSLGTGGTWALAAIDHGKSAKEAVEYAMTRDPFTGGEVHVFEVK